MIQRSEEHHLAVWRNAPRPGLSETAEFPIDYRRCRRVCTASHFTDRSWPSGLNLIYNLAHEHSHLMLSCRPLC
eukprot:6214210-Pleurochrysis_carterae.AAC.1